ncbi:MAG: DNA replication/repair protein RecF [Gammaproteobacteria bacterium]|nr:DNA replication/repair protein RecF [Gammaproteobacteria bacterium]
MSISQLSLTDFRNLNSATLEFHPKINLITGGNASGKTSLLESIHVLCQACSFRTHQLKQCIAHGKPNFLLFGRFGGYKAGLSKSDAKLEIRINGEPIRKRSVLVSKTPVKIVNTDSFNLISGLPQERRKYLDWCLFHVEHQYTQHWVEFKHALRQRNRLLRSRQDLNLLDYWNEYLVGPSLAINNYRKRYVHLISAQLAGQLPRLLEEVQITLDYVQGWPEQQDLNQCLQDSRANDIKSGFTGYGIHRDNLKILADGLPAAQVLSRGQLKRLCLAMIVSVLKIVREKSSKPIILLIDDLRSELDEKSQQNIYRQLMDIDLQLFISNIEDQVPAPLQEKEFKMIHVEHGIIKTRKIN